MSLDKKLGFAVILALTGLLTFVAIKPRPLGPEIKAVPTVVAPDGTFVTLSHGPFLVQTNTSTGQMRLCAIAPDESGGPAILCKPESR